MGFFGRTLARNFFNAIVVSLLALSSGESGDAPIPPGSRGWDRIPSVVISAQEGDPRIAPAMEAVNFWNKQFAEIGTPFRLGPVLHSTEALPWNYLATMSDAVLSRNKLPAPHDVVRRIKADLIIAMSDGEFVSFSTAPRPGGRVIVGIRSHKSYPLTLPNVVQNVIAHELGHAIGLQHNSDPTKLMCGRPAPCRPDAFRSSDVHFFPLTDEDKALLLMLYPPSWAPRG